MGRTGTRMFAVAVDANGNAYITGRAAATLPGSAENGGGMFVAKYDTNGDRQWVHELNSLYDTGNGIAADRNGNAYFTGSTVGLVPGSPNPNAGSNDVVVAKYLSHG